MTIPQRLPSYRWREAPDHLKTKAQLAELGKRPGGQQIAWLIWGSSRRPQSAALFDVATAKARRKPTAAQLAALEKAQIARRTCPICKEDKGYVLNGGMCSSCADRERKQGVAKAIREFLRHDPLILDTETTDLDGYLVEIAVIDAQGNVLLNTRVNPKCEIAPEAEAVHGITCDLLTAAPVFADVEPQLETLLTGRLVAVYNVDFDCAILCNEFRRLDKQSWIKRVDWRDVMEVYAEWCGDWSDYHGAYRWQPLPGGDHSALGDCQATLQLLKRMSCDEPEVPCQS